MFALSTARLFSVVVVLHVVRPSFSSPRDSLQKPRRSAMTVAGYIPDYRFGIDVNETALHLTDLILFSVAPEMSGSVGAKGGRRPCCLLSSHFKRARQARAHKKNRQDKSVFYSTHLIHVNKGRDLNLLVSVGGAGRSDSFYHVVADEERRKALIEDLLQLCQKEELDGVDFDWEQPVSKEQYIGYFRLILETANAFHSMRGTRSLLVTVALHPGQFFSPQVYDAVDRVHLMTYDMIDQSSLGTENFHHSSLAKTVEAIQGFEDSGCPPWKLSVGIPVYARHSANPSSVKTYSEIVEMAIALKQGEDASLQLNTMNSFQGFVFDSPEMVRRKVKWSKEKSLSGVFFWEVGQDYKTDGTLGISLVVAASQEAEGIKPSTADMPPETSSEL